MAADYLVPWLNASGQDGLRKSMLVAQGDSVTKTFTFNFAGGYISKDHVKAYVYDTVAGTTAPQVITPSMWSGPNQITFPAAFPNTQYLVIYRDTPKDTPLVSFANGAILNEPNLDEMAEQSVFAAAETQDRFDLVNDGSTIAINNAATALLQSNKAISDSSAATVTSAAAKSTADAAKAVADDANTTANAASDTANGIDAKATAALSNSNSAVSTANSANNTANGIDAKATKAQSDAAAAVVTANAASNTATAAKATADGVDAKAQSALDKANSAVQRAGDTMTGPMTFSSTTNYSRTVWNANGYTPSLQADKAANQIGFVNAANTSYNLWVYDGGQVATRGALTVGGSAYASGGNATIAANGDVWGTAWNGGGWLSAYLGNKLNITGGNVLARINFTQAGWQADLGLHNWRSGQDAWVYLRARDGGGLDIINSAYNAVPWQVDNGGTVWQAGSLNVGAVRFQTDGNIIGGSMPWGDLFSAINVKVNNGTQATHRAGVNEFASINVGYAANTADAGSPWVLIGLRSQNGSNVTYLRANWLAVG
ncbi:phage tail fiber domain-containing protein [Burkholderia ambifaria]